MGALLIAASSSCVFGQTWDLVADWSDTDNPNGPWSYNGSPGVPITNHLDDYDPSTASAFGSPQPAWAEAVFPQNNHVPVWFKRVSDYSGFDIPIGAVGMHGTEADDPPQWVGVSWTSPVDEAVDLSGVVWYAHTGIQRSSNWQIRVNNIVITGGTVAWTDGSSSEFPIDLADGSGGALALDSIGVDPGDVITLEFKSFSTYACLLGVGLTITVDPCYADMNDDNLLDLADVNVFVSAFLSGAPVADIAEPFGVFDLADVLLFIDEFLAGCP
ncbi:MAG: hypothetical protein H6810_10670 [Phycisphaeraceae bacterium]|nr:MAG: hypothetical protein H6810_10670 [Phycisphaeraceae bacterium]